ncbi:hypothetical protein [Streptomyces sp. Inha503]|uniref:hypothetical protein n=1 Tax=Streptomyces sp. Inha503 TaxID=3383314 RepID=UPI0039A24607
MPRARGVPLSAPPPSYAAAVERYLTGAVIEKSSARIYRISLSTWGWILRGEPASASLMCRCRHKACSASALASPSSSPGGSRWADAEPITSNPGDTHYRPPDHTAWPQRCLP